MEATLRCGDLWKECKRLTTAQKLRRIYLKLRVSSYSKHLKEVDPVRKYRQNNYFSIIFYVIVRTGCLPCLVHARSPGV